MTTRLYKVKAVYKSVREVIVQVGDGEDPLDVSNWGDMQDESEVDFYLYDTEGDAVEVDDQHREIE